MRPIGDLEANGEVERLDCDPSRYIDGSLGHDGVTTVAGVRWEPNPLEQALLLRETGEAEAPA